MISLPSRANDRTSPWMAGMAGAMLALGCAGRLSGDVSRYRVDKAELGCAPALFQTRCASQFCHGGAHPTGGLDLGSPGYRSRLVGVPASYSDCKSRLLVDPAAPEKSFLLEKVSSSTPSCGEPMPLQEQPLSDGELACVRTFIGDLLGLEGGIPAFSSPDASPSERDSSPSGSPSSRDASVAPPPDGTPRPSGPDAARNVTDARGGG